MSIFYMFQRFFFVFMQSRTTLMQFSYRHLDTLFIFWLWMISRYCFDLRNEFSMEILVVLAYLSTHYSFCSNQKWILNHILHKKSVLSFNIIHKMAEHLISYGFCNICGHFCTVLRIYKCKIKFYKCKIKFYKWKTICRI